jgi:superfamily I DNA/RNA helicase
MSSNFYEEIVAKVYAAYERKKAAGALDFDDHHRDGAAVPRHPDVLRSYQERFATSWSMSTRTPPAPSTS